MLDNLYTEEFYAGHVDVSVQSAKVILGLLFKEFMPASVVDVGCGKGGWLSVAESLGSSKLRGFDGHWVDESKLLSQRIEFTPVDFDNDFIIEGKYELCISLEVAEHVSQHNANKFIDRLCNASDVVLFGAAIKYQGGTNHVNEQPQSYWIDIFKSNGYECFDCVRPKVWDDRDVGWWYRQNTFVFVRKGSSTLNTGALKKSEKLIQNIVHPKIFEEKAEPLYKPTFIYLYRYLKRYIAYKFGILKV